MAQGKPIIGTQGEGIAEILDHHEVGKAVPPKDVPAIITALRDLLRHPERAKEMGEQGKNLVTREFTWQYNAQKTLEVYREAMDIYS
jgi:glycosyltransferase involved in cell wall biosynthesis